MTDDHVLAAALRPHENKGLAILDPGLHHAQRTLSINQLVIDGVGKFSIVRRQNYGPIKHLERANQTPREGQSNDYNEPIQYPE